MPPDRFQQYREAEVLASDPVKLVNLLYRGALEAVRAARFNMASGDIRERSRQIMRAWEIVRELAISLDREKGGEIARRLSELYAYIQQRLLDANTTQADEPLAEAEKLLGTLAEAWHELKVPAAAAAILTEEYRPIRCLA